MTAILLIWLAAGKAARGEAKKAEVLERLAKAIGAVAVFALLFGWATHAVFASDLAGSEAVLQAAQVLECTTPACTTAVLEATRDAANAGAWLTWSHVTMIFAALL